MDRHGPDWWRIMKRSFPYLLSPYRLAELSREEDAIAKEEEVKVEAENDEDGQPFTKRGRRKRRRRRTNRPGEEE